MTPLDWYPRPQPDTGLGFHDSSSVGGNPPDIEKHAAALAASGLRWYKLLAADESKVGRAATYERHGIRVVLRLWAPDPFPHWRPDPGHLRAYRAVGVDYFELGNEPNLGGSVEWAGGVMPGPGAFGEQVGRFWVEGAARVKAEGGIPLFPAMTPGGSYDHRLALADVFDYLARVGGLSSFDGAGVAIHPRPMTFPPDHPATEHATVTFNEYQWIAGLLRARLGWVPPLFATEHGYARKDSTNTGFPPMTDQTWAGYNRTLFERMNPAHPQAVEPYLFCLLYWLEAAGGTWQSDEASPGWWPDTSTPWAREIAAIGAGWHRTTDDSPPPPPPEPDMLTTFLRDRLGSRFEDLRATLPGRGYSFTDSRAMPYLAIHHTTGPRDVTAASIARFHVEDRGYPGIGYHFMIRLGKALYVGDVDTQRAHVKDRNDEALGIAVAGDYHEQGIAEEDLTVLRDLTLSLDEWYGHEKQIVGHRDLMAPNYTTCPARLVEAFGMIRTGPIPVPLRYDKIAWGVEAIARLLATEGWVAEHDHLLASAVYLDAVEKR